MSALASLELEARDGLKVDKSGPLDLGTSPPSDASRTPAAPRSDQAEIRLTQGVRIDLLGEPVAKVIDDQTGESWRLRFGQGVTFPKGVSRKLRLEMETPGWQLSHEQIEIEADSANSIDVLAVSKNMVALGVRDEATDSPIEDFMLRVIWEDSKGGMSSETSMLPTSAPGGEFLIEGVPLDEGRFRVEVSIAKHLVARSSWFEARSIYIHSMDAKLRTREGDTSWVTVSVLEKGTGAPIVGTPVQLFEELPGAVVSSIVLSSGGFVAQRPSLEGVGSMQIIPLKKTDHLGVATFEVQAPNTYRAVTGSDHFPVALSESFTTSPSNYTDIQIVIDTPASLIGKLQWPVSQGGTVEALESSSVWLSSGETLLSATFSSEGLYAFPSVAPGEYLLSVERSFELADGQQLSSKVLSRTVVLEPGYTTTLDLVLYDLAAPGLVVGSLANPLLPAKSVQLIAISKAAAGVASQALMVTEADSEGAFEFFGVPPGSWTVVAMGQSADQHSISLLFGDVEIDGDGNQVGALVLEQRGLPLRVTVELASPEEHLSSLVVSATEMDDLYLNLIGELPALSVSTGRTSVIYGLPEGNLFATHGGETKAINPARTVKLPFTSTQREE